MVKPLLLLCISLNALADDRSFPAQAKRGALSITKMADLVIDGKLKLTTPSTRIYSEDGMLITASTLDAVKAPVNYIENEFGEIETLWLLTAEEAKASEPKKTYKKSNR